LRPTAVNDFVVRRNFAFKLCADRGDLEMKLAGTKRDGAGFHGENGLIETVQSGMELAAGTAGEMQNQVKLRIASLERAGVGAFEGYGLRMNGFRRRSLTRDRRSGSEQEELEENQCAR